MKGLWKFAVAVAVILGLAGMASGLVLAQTGEEEATPAAPAEEAAPEDGTLDGEGPNFVARLAENLGMTEEELRAAVVETEFEIVDGWLAEGRIDEEQAERLRERIEERDGDLFAFKHHRPHGPHLGVALGEDLAEFLGITVEELREARQDEQSLAQIAEANGVSRDELISFLVGQVEEGLATKVEEGLIDQDQADEMLARFEENVDELIDRTEPFRPFGPKGRFGPGGFPGGPPLEDDESDLTAA